MYLEVYDTNLVARLNAMFVDDESSTFEICVYYASSQLHQCWTFRKNWIPGSYKLTKYTFVESKWQLERFHVIKHSAQGSVSLPRVDHREACLRLLYRFRLFLLNKAVIYLERSSRPFPGYEPMVAGLESSMWYPLCALDLLARERLEIGTNMSHLPHHTYCY